MLIPVFKKLAGLGHKLTKVVKQAYDEAGKPYRETEDGIMRPLGESARAARLVKEAEEIILWHKAVADPLKSINSEGSTKDKS